MPLHTLGTSPLGSHTLGGGRVVPAAAPSTTGPYFPPGYFSALGGLAGIGYPAGVGYPTAGGYWPGRYWPGTYFAPTYWPARPVELRATAGTFLAAVRGALLDDAPLMAGMPGGWWHRIAARGIPEPVGVILVIPIDDATSTTAADFTSTGQLQLTVYGPDARRARDLANRASAVLSDAPLRWATGQTVFLRLANPASATPPAPGYGGSAVVGEIRILKFINAGNYQVNE